MSDEHDDRAEQILTAWDIHMDGSQAVSLDTRLGENAPGRIPCGRWTSEQIHRGRAFLAAELRRAFEAGAESERSK